MSELSYAERRAATRNSIKAELARVAPDGLGVVVMAEILGRNMEGIMSMMRRMAKQGEIHSLVYMHSALFFLNAKDRDAFDKGALLKNRAPLQLRIVEFVAMFRLGVAQPQIREELELRESNCSGLINKAQMSGRLFSLGPKTRMRYFVDEAQMESVREEALADIERERAEHLKSASIIKREKRKELERKRYLENGPRNKTPPKKATPKPKKPKATKASKAGHSDFAANTFQKRTAPKAPPKPVGPAIVPDHVKVQVIPGFTRGRFEVTEAPPLFSLVGIGRDVNTGRAWGQP